MTEDKKYNYVYLVTNLINGKQYIGDHSTNNLNDKYFGSGKIIKDAIRLYKKNNFKKNILKLFANKKDAFQAQQVYINEYNTLAPNGYNISPKGGHQVTNGVSDETKKKMKIAAKNRPTQSKETRIKRNQTLKGHEVSAETKNKICQKQKGISKKDIFIRKYGEIEGNKKYNNFIEKMSMTQSNMSQEIKNKIRIGTKIAMQNLEIKKKISESKKGKIPWNKKII